MAFALNDPLQKWKIYKDGHHTSLRTIIHQIMRGSVINSLVLELFRSLIYSNPNYPQRLFNQNTVLKRRNNDLHVPRWNIVG